MTPATRFTFYHDTVSPSGTIVNQPLGWRDIVLSLTRDPAYHSLIEYFKGGFVWYGSARDFIMECEDADGPEVKIRCLIEIRFNATWSTIFDGLIDVSQKEELSMANRFYKYAAPIIRNDFWATFMNRRTVKVDLEAAVDLEGNARTAVNKITLPLPSQAIRNKFERQIDWADNVTRTIDETAIISADVSGTTTQYLIFSNAILVVDEISTRVEHGTILSVVKPTLDGKYILKADFAGSYNFEASIRYTIILSSSRNFDVKWYRAIKSEGVITETQIGSTQSGTNSLITDDGARTLSLTVDLLVGDEFYIYGEVVISSAVSTMSFFPDYDSDLGAPYDPVYTQLEITADTIFPDSTTDAYLIKDAFESVLSKIIGQNSVIESTMFTTCKRLNAVFRGMHGRGYSFTDKPFTTSFDELWRGFEPVANTGLGYTEVAGVKKIQIENKSFFYGQTPSVFLSNISGLTRRYDLEKHYKTIEVGYSKRFIESAGGVDDPQTLSSWRTKFRTIGSDLKIISTFFLASLGIEQNRRNRIELNKDGKIDEDIIMVAVKEDGSDYTPEIGTDFNAITGLLNSSTRYNIRHVCARVFKRWQSFIQGCLQHTTSEYFYYSGGEGNRVMSSQFETTDCEATDDPEPVLVEDADIAVSTTDYLFIPKVFKCKVPMSKVTYDAILADKENAIAISQDATTYIPMHILDFDYKIFGGYADLLLLQASATTVTPGADVILQEDGNAILMEDGSSNILIE